MGLYTIARKPGTGAIIWSEDQKQYIKHKYVDEDKTLAEIAKEFQVQPQTIRNLLRKMKIEITNKKIRNYPRNSKYFNEIDTAEKAYWLGVFFADGSVASKSNTIALGLKDKEHIEKFKRAIGAINNKITETQDNRFSKECIMYSLAIRDKGLHDALISQGCVPDKTHASELHIPKISDEYKWDFIRGYFDGDGCISWSKANNRYYISWIGNQFLLEDIRSLCQKEKVSLSSNVKSSIVKEFRLNGKKDVLDILQKMYKNATKESSLDRKVVTVNSCLQSLGASPLNL